MNEKNMIILKRAVQFSSLLGLPIAGVGIAMLVPLLMSSLDGFTHEPFMTLLEIAVIGCMIWLLVILFVTPSWQLMKNFRRESLDSYPRFIALIMLVGFAFVAGSEKGLSVPMSLTGLISSFVVYQVCKHKLIPFFFPTNPEQQQKGVDNSGKNCKD